MKVVSKSFINESRKEVGARPITRVSLYAKYPGPIRSIASSCYYLGSVVARTVSVYGNAARFFQSGDSIIIKSTPLTGVGSVLTSPTFDGTDTTMAISNIYLNQSNIGGHILRDVDFKFSVGST